MAFVTIPSGAIDVGDPVTKDLWDKVKGNDDDHETRINSLESGSGSITVIDDLIVNSSQFASTTTFEELILFRAGTGFTLTTALLTQIDAGLVGTLEVDILKATGIGGAFASVFSTKPSIASKDSTITVVDYTLLSGDTFTVAITGGATTVLTEGVDWTAATSNNATATSLASAINGVTGVAAPAPGAAIITVSCDNATQALLTTSDGTNITISQANVAGANTPSTNQVFSTTAVLAGDFLRFDITSFQTNQNRFHFVLAGVP